MTNQISRQLSIAFTVYNKARAEARRRGDAKYIEALNKVLGRMVKAAYRRLAGHVSSAGLS